MTPSIRKRSALKLLAAKVTVVGITVAVGVWAAAKMVPPVKSSGGRVEAIFLQAEAQTGRAMWDPRNPSTAAALTDPGKVRKVAEAASGVR